jgi:hypothetical protein
LGLKECNKNRTRKFKHSFMQLRVFLNEWDPLCSSEADEYDCLNISLLSLLMKKAGEEEILCHLKKELSKHFGVNPSLLGPEEFVRRIVVWYYGVADDNPGVHD